MNGFNKRKYGTALNQAATITASTTGNTVDTQGYGLAVFHVQVGTSTTADGSNYFTVSLEASDDSGMSGAVPVTASNGLVGANLVINATSDANLSNAIGYNGNLRYVRLVLTETGTASVQVCGTYSLEQPSHAAAISNTAIAS